VSQQELLAKTVRALNAAQIPYLITGSVASTYYGEPRSTHDIDFVVRLNRQQIVQLSGAFPEPDFHFDVDAANEALRSQSMFNIIDVHGGDKIDVWMLTSTPFDNSRFARRREAKLAGVQVYLPTPEDVILAKLQWARLAGGSDKQLNDAAGVYEVQREQLDEAYLGEWVDKLGLDAYWKALQEIVSR
jgi:hypothetical protein